MRLLSPGSRLRAELRAPALSTNYGLTGTAFDYLLRFYVEKLNPGAKTKPWVAQNSLAILGLTSRKSTDFKRAQRIIDTAKHEHDAYLKPRSQLPPDEKLIRAAIDLAQVDLVYRIGLLDIRPIDDAVVDYRTRLEESKDDRGKLPV